MLTETTDVIETRSASTFAKYETVATKERLADWIKRICKAGYVAIDTETDRLDAQQANLAGISLSLEPGSGCYIPVGHSGEGQLDLIFVLEELKPILRNPCITKILHNAKYDMAVFNRYGLFVFPVEDTMLMSYSLYGGKHRHNMDDLAKLYLGHTTTKISELIGSGANQITFNQVPIEPATHYAAEDSDVTLGLFDKLDVALQDDAKSNWIYENVEKPIVLPIFDMERTGILIDVPLLNSLTVEYEARMTALLSEAYEVAGVEFNPASPQQVGAVFKSLGIDTNEETETGQMATGAKILEAMEESPNISKQGQKLIKLILEWRKYAKLVGTYTSALPEEINPSTGRVHTSYGLASTTTGRLASSDPNIQNIPVRTTEGRKLREAFIAPEGHKLISADYSQIELRLVAFAANDTNMLAAFAAGRDIHRTMAAKMKRKAFEEVTDSERRDAKAVNFGIIYGTSAYGLARNQGISVDEAESVIEKYFDEFPGILNYMTNAKAFARKFGFVRTFFGRRIWTPEILSKNKAKAGHAERAAINAPIQGTAADVIKIAMAKTHGLLHGTKTKLLLQVHDELIFEVPDDEVSQIMPAIVSAMASVGDQVGVPLLVEAKTGQNWEAAH